jgi:endonuclease/exonuclease/phosphatase family metal-dependent hydrolase
MQTGSTRRAFLMTGAAAALAAATRPAISHVAAPAPASRPPGLRSITYNIFIAKGYPETDANKALLAKVKPQIPQRLGLELALYDPDIVTFQESPPEEKVAETARVMGLRHAYFPGGFPGAVLTRFEIIESKNCPLASGGERPKELFTRHWGYALLRTPEGELPVFSAHLHPSDDAVREREVTEVLAVLKPHLEAGRSLLFQGDLNHKPDGPEYPRWIKAGLVDAFVQKGVGQPMTFTCTTLEKRIDFVFAAGPLARRIAECRVLREGGFRTNGDDPCSFALSDHMPVMATFAHGDG